MGRLLAANGTRSCVPNRVEDCMKRLLTISGICAVLALCATSAHASVIFTFAESGGTVVMTSSGTLDTTRLVSVVRADGWGGTGIENNGSGDIDIMGGTSFGQIDTQFGFNAGTDASAITNPGGPFTFDDFNVASIAGSRSFTTYSGFIGGLRQPGIGMRGVDIVAGLWTPDQAWSWGAGQTFASLGLNPGTYAVSDSQTGETITIQVGASVVPEPATLLLLGSALGSAGLRRRMQKRT
jgi:hypothetical protein